MTVPVPTTAFDSCPLQSSPGEKSLAVADSAASYLGLGSPGGNGATGVIDQNALFTGVS